MEKIEIVTVGQAAKENGISRQCIYGYIRRGSITPVNINGRVYIRKDDFELLTNKKKRLNK